MTGHLLAARAFALLALSARPILAQLPSASAPALGMADNYIALATGSNAVAWNPAMLAMPGHPRYSIAILPVRGNASLAPVSILDIARYRGEFITDGVKQEWLRRIAARGAQAGNATADVTYFALSVGRVGVQLSTTSHFMATLSPDAAELILFGNAHRRAGDDFELGDSRFHGLVMTTAAVGVAQAFRLLSGDLTLGATIKYMMGNALVYGRNVGSSVSSAGDLDVVFPIIQSDAFGPSPDMDRGRGVGLDLGGAWRGDRLTVGLAMQGVMNTFAWDTSAFLYRPGRVRLDERTHEAEFGFDAYGNAPTALKAGLGALAHEPQLLLGVAWRAAQRVTLTGDVRQSMGRKLEARPESHAGIGAELRLSRTVPLRAGWAVVSGGSQLGGGVGIELGRWDLSASVGRRTTELGSDTIAALGLVFAGR